MLQRAILVVAIFLAILLALTFGHALLAQAYVWVARLTGWVIHNFSDVYWGLHHYISTHTTKVLLAIALTVPVSWWVFRNRGQELRSASSNRKVAIVLAICLGWLGAHHFYLGQIGRGVVYLLILWFFPPLVIVLSLIDAIRYFFMSDEQFAVSRV
ncbi:MAG TPA: TM2 domain-containing protein [Burkholderiaceae bacterium]|nr:TM2 domain-containing protein [Burkholderiaceae bacterium]